MFIADESVRYKLFVELISTRAFFHIRKLDLKSNTHDVQMSI